MWPFKKKPKPKPEKKTTSEERGWPFVIAVSVALGLGGGALHHAFPEQTILILEIGGGAFATRWLYRKITAPPTLTLEDMNSLTRRDAHGSAKYATPNETLSLGTPKNGIFFGQSFSRSMTYTDYTPFLKQERKTHAGNELGPHIYSAPNAHTIVCAPTRSGKGVAVLVPTLLKNTNSVLAIDPKGELAAITARQRQKLGQDVFILNPWALHDQLFKSYGFTQTHSFNPLDILDPQDPAIVSNALFLAGLLVSRSSSSDPFWDQSTESLLTGLMLYVADCEPTNKTFTRIRRILHTPQELDNVLAAMAASKSFSGSLADIGNSFLTMPDKTKGSVLSTAQAHLKFLLDPRAAAALDHSSFSFSTLKEKPTTVYLIIPPEQLHAQARWLRLMIGAAIKAFQSPTAPKTRCLFILEEFASLGHMQAIQDGVSTLAGYGVDFLFILQDLPQLKGLYGQAAQTFIANSAFRFFTNIGDPETAKFLSEAMGRESVTVTSTSGESGEHATTSKMGRPLATPDEILRAGTGKGFLLQPGTLPILIALCPYYEMDYCIKNADPNPYRPAQPSKTPPPTETFEDPSRCVSDGYREFLPIIEADMRGWGETAIADGLAVFKKRFDQGVRDRYIPFLMPDEKKRLSKLLTKASRKYKGARIEDKDRTQMAQRTRISQYLAEELSKGNLYDKIHDKDLSDFLEGLAPKHPTVPMPKPAPEKSIQPDVPKQEPTPAKTSGLPKPYKEQPPGTESSTKQYQDAIRKIFQSERPGQLTPSSIPPLDFSDSTHLSTVKEYLIELLPAMQEDLTNGSFRAEHGDIQQTLASAVPAFVDALSSGDEMGGLLLQLVTLLEGIAGIYAKEIREHPQYPKVFLSSAIEKYKIVKYLAQKAQYGSLDTSITQGDINFFNSTLQLP